MPDFATSFDGTTLSGDLALAGAGMAVDPGLETAVALSLFSDARALPDDLLPAGEADPRGWWGDMAPPTEIAAEGDRFGSRLWLLAREKQTQETLNRAREYAGEALAWLIDDGIASRVTVVASWARTGVLALEISVDLVAGALADYHFEQSLGGV